MATKKTTNVKVATKVDEKVSNDTIEVKEVKEETSSQMQELFEMMSSMKREMEAVIQENKELKSKLEEKETALPVTQVVSAPYEGERKIRIYHMQEMVGGTSTHIKLTNTTRDLKTRGQLMTLGINDFEEVAGKYKHYFDRGILAVDVKDMDYAEMYDLPIYDPQSENDFNFKSFKDVVKYNYDQLQNFYSKLSENNQSIFLSYWLGKVYEKTPGYYDMEKLRWLDRISGTSTFSVIIVEMENKNRQSSDQNVFIDANKI